MKSPRKVFALMTCLALAGVMAAPSSAQAVGAKVAHFHFNGPLIEQPQGDMGFSFGGQMTSLKSLVERIEKAGKDDEIRAILITFGSPSMGLAQIQEVRQALSKVDKPIWVHLESATTFLYALACGGSHINMTPTGDLWLLGFYSEAPYLKGLLDKIHVEADFVHIGDFKSAGETLYRTEPSEAAEKNMNWLLDGLYESTLQMIADSRFSGDKEKAEKVVNQAMFSAEQAKEAGLIDSVCHTQDLVDKFKDMYGEDVAFVKNYGTKGGPEIDFNNPFAIFKVLGEMMSNKPKPQGDAIAVVYVDGAIMTGESEPNLFGGSTGAFSTTIRRGLDEAADDDSIKALVLRVDSPGGSALASEIILNAVKRVQAKGKPVIVSMGNVAASGGYYVSCSGDHIIADPATITASIGVVGGKIVTTGMWNAIGVNWKAYQRGEHAGIMATDNAWTEEERARIRGWMEDVYAIFKGHITEYRGDKLSKPLDEMAGGRVFTGRQALKLGLVDELGTFDDAVDKAAAMATIADYDIRVLPRPKNFLDILTEGMGTHEQDQIRIEAGPTSRTSPLVASPFLRELGPVLQSLDPQRTGCLMQALNRIEILRRENVVLMAPEDFVIRCR